MTLKRYWFIISPEDRFGARNIGVTAFSKEEAQQLIVTMLSKTYFDSWLVNLNDDTEVIEDIDVQLLDENHVRPNMGIVTFKGVWFPNFSFIE